MREPGTSQANPENLRGIASSPCTTTPRGCRGVDGDDGEVLGAREEPRPGSAPRGEEDRQIRAVHGPVAVEVSAGAIKAYMPMGTMAV